MKRLTATLLVLSLLALGSTSLCRAEDKQDTAPPEDLKALVRGNNEFAFDLYARLSKKEGNVLFSPYSISNALAMTYAGARGETAAEMVRTLHFALGQQRLHPAFASVNRQLQKEDPKGSAQLHVANALWGQQGFPFRPEFLRLTQDHYGAGLREVDFRAGSEAARGAINRWVEEQTKNKIVELLTPGTIDNKTRLVLTNAVYFKADWPAPFDKKFTKEVPFHLTAQEKATVPMMYQNWVTGYYDGDGIQLLELPYCNKRWSFIVVLPRKAEDLADVEKALNAGWLEERIVRLKDHLVQLNLPKFKLRDQIKLGKQLADMGMPFAFSSRADFTGICSHDDLSLCEVINQTFMVVNEEGTEATAATAVVTGTPVSIPAPLPRAVFVADHPFILLIRDNPTGCILLLGRLTDPRSN